MESSLQRRVQRYGWDKASPFYEASWHEQLKPAQDLLLEMAAIQAGEHVLDIACGTGLVTFRAREMTGAGGFVLGTDISDKMIELAREMTQKLQFTDISFERMDAEAMELEDETFEVALCALGLMYMPDPQKALKEIFRTLKPGGRAVAAVWGKRTHCGWADIFDIVDQRVASEVCPMFFNLGNPEILPISFKLAGFVGIASKTFSTSLLYKTGDEACVAAFAGGPVALAYHKFSEQVRKEVHEAYLASIEQYKLDDGYSVPGEFVLSMGYKPSGV
jgi:ubiquinone/menaquinone biosynthesis C-methylase UbiE